MKQDLGPIVLTVVDDAGARALERLAHAPVPAGRVFIDGGDPLRDVTLPTTG